MEPLIALAVLLALAILLAPFVALVIAIGLRNRVLTLEEEGEARKRELRWLHEQLKALKVATSTAAPPTASTAAPPTASTAAPPTASSTSALAASATEGAPSPAGLVSSAPGAVTPQDAAPSAANLEASRPIEGTPTVEGAPPVAAAAPVEHERPGHAPIAATAPVAGAPPVEHERPGHAPIEGAPPVAAAPRVEHERPGHGPSPKAPAPAAATPEVPFEQRLATYFTRVGAGALLLGVLYFFKYAADNEWIGPAGRVLLGAFAGIAILVVGEIVRPKTHPGYVHALVGVGIAVLYIAAWASSARYHLVDTATAFAAETVILLLGAALAYRHSGEAVLVLVLVAGFANPILLSTGEDRPFALFSYLFLLTGVSLVVSVLREMRIPIFLSMLGVSALFAGWYDRYFEVFDQIPGGVDLPPEQLAGAYGELSARAVPLGAAVLFTLEWIAAAFALAARDALPRLVVPLAVLALLFAHAAASALLFDRPIALGAAMIILALGSVAALRALDAVRYLLLPMLAATILLAVLTKDARSQDHALLLLLLAVWCGVYLNVFLRDAFKEGRNVRAAAIQASVALFSFGGLDMIILLSEARFRAAAFVLAPWSIAIVAIAVRGRLPSLSLAGLIGSFFPFALAAGMAQDNARETADPVFLALAAGWALAYVGGVLIDLSAKRETEHASIAVLGFAGLGFLAIALVATPESLPTLRALMTAAVGALDLALAVRIRRTREDRAPWVRILAALALGLFAPAVAFGLSGATVTVVWAVIAAAALLILAEARDRVWLTVAVLLALATLIRAFAVDFPSVERQELLFESTRGRLGTLAVHPFFNPRAYALGGSGLAFLGGAILFARRLARHGETKLLSLAALIVATGWALITTCAVVETQTLLLGLPAPPPFQLDPEEFAVFMESVRSAEEASSSLRAMATTVILAGIAMLLVGIGFAARNAFHRYLGLALFLATVLKLVLWDVWNLARIYQIVVLGVVGALLLGSGFLYARLKALFRGGTASWLLVATSVLFAGESRADPPVAPEAPIHLFRSRSAIEGVAHAGDHRIRLGSELFMRSLAESPLADLRIADADGREVPFVARVTPPLRVLSTVPGRILDPGRIDGGAFRATFELPLNTEHCTVELDLVGAPPYLRKTRIETGHTPQDLQLVSEGAMVYAIDVQGSSARNATVRYPPSTSRYVRITLLPDPSAEPTEIAAATFSCGGEETLPRFARIPLAIVGTRTDPEKKTTEIDLDAGADGVPIEKIAIRVTTPEFVRRVQVLASSHKTAWPTIGSGVIYRVGREGPESTSVPVSLSRRRYLRLVIEDGSDAALTIPQVEGAYAEHEIVFRARTGGPHLLYIGDDTNVSPPPSYDLAEILARRTEPVELAEARLGPFTDNPEFGHEPPKALPFTERHRGVIGIALTMMVVGLAFWAARLVRGDE